MTNDAVLTNQLTSIRNFTDSINFSKLSNLNSASITASAGDAYAIKGDQVTFGWVANPESDVAGVRVTVGSLKNGRYKLRLYHTWRGRFLSEEEISVKNGSVTFQIPRLFGTGSHANYIGEDAAFILELSQ
jgi:hypothetical protein